METITLDVGLLQTTAPNGLIVLSERLPGVRSAAVGVWVRIASAHERREQMGISHLLEHMVFKGTERRTARQLAMELEVRGGSLDAYTSRDHTNYQAHVLDADLPLAVEILTDLVRFPLLRDSDLANERNVILEEISGVEDNPDDLVFELHGSAMWPDHPYGYSILGTPETVSTISVGALRDLHTAGYHRGNCVVAAAGNLNHDQLLTVLEREGWLEATGPVAARTPVVPEPAARNVVRYVERDTSQAHIVLGTDSFPNRDPRRYALAILTNVFGGGMSSRLFQRVREELGLAYAIYAWQHFYDAAGQIGVYVGTQAGKAAQALDAIRAELDLLAREGLSTSELADGKQQLKGQVMLSLESTISRMTRLASVPLKGDRYRPLDEILAEIDAVTPDQIRALAAEFFAPDRQVVLQLGPNGLGRPAKTTKAAAAPKPAGSEK